MKLSSWRATRRRLALLYLLAIVSFQLSPLMSYAQNLGQQPATGQVEFRFIEPLRTFRQRFRALRQHGLDERCFPLARGHPLILGHGDFTGEC